MAKYLLKAKDIMSGFDEATVTHIPRGENARADILSKLVSTKQAGCHRTVVQQNLDDPVCMMAISVEADWKKPIEDYLERGIIPDDAMEAKMLVRDAAKYTMVEDQLYRKGLHSPMLRCLNPNEAGYVLAEKRILRPLLNNVIAVRSMPELFGRPSRATFHLGPTAFYKWGMDILGPFKTAPGQLRWLIVAVDYFTKWIEAEPLTTISSARVQRFVEVNIITRFGAQAEIVTDNGTQFTESDSAI
ncbi:hypothetical protein K1719_038021 [Acacia pycnantha]|nr:hypothetical protein K1719_038021 [Acacia pycnantha]